MNLAFYWKDLIGFHDKLLSYKDLQGILKKRLAVFGKKFLENINNATGKIFRNMKTI